jgi:hypothetical protein
MLACATAAALMTMPAIPELAGRVELEAAALSREAPKGAGTPPFNARLKDFAAHSMELSQALRAAGAASDLPCIFKGISEDAQARADEIIGKVGPDRSFAVDALQALLQDAVDLAPQAAALKPAVDPHDILK